MFALVKEGRARRFTFSRDLAEFIQTKNPDYEIVLLDLVVGRPAREGDEGLFGIIDKRKGKLLRATSSWKEAQLLTQDSSRGLCLCYVKRMKSYAAPLCDRP